MEHKLQATIISSRKPAASLWARAHLLELGLLLIALGATGARAWRAFDAFDAPRPFGDYFQPPPSPSMQNFHYSSQPINLPPFSGQNGNNQLQNYQILTPTTSNNHHNLQAAHTDGQPVLQFAADGFQGQAGGLNSSPVAPQQEFAKQDTGHEPLPHHQLGARDAPTREPAAAAIAADKPQADAPDGQKAANSAEVLGPSPFGKILDSAPREPPANATNKRSPSENEPSVATAGDAAKPAAAAGQQALKPRKAGQPAARKTTPASLEQQIIDQHARAAAGYNSHTSQYATSPAATSSQPTAVDDKNGANQGAANNRGLGALLFRSLGALAGGLQPSELNAASAGPPANSEQPGAGVSALLSNFKSGITSRSSIMKAAISDNKLARTLTSVGKTLGGNKYVASAGIAAALAALGLTVGKFLTPYSMVGEAGQFSNPGADPMLTSGSIMAPSFANYLGGNERQLMASAPYAAPSSPPSFMESLAMSASNRAPFGYEPAGEYTGQAAQPQFEAGNQMAGYDQATLSQYAQAAGLYPSSQHALNSMQPAGFAYTMSGPSEQQQQAYAATLNGFTHLIPRRLRPQMMASAPNPLDSANGHYSSFYNQATSDETGDQSMASSMSGMPQQQQHQHQQQTYGSYISGSPSMPGTGNQEAASAVELARAQSALNLDQLQPAASYPSVTYQQAPPAGLARQQGVGPRRSGAVLLKLDESTRSRLKQQLRAPPQSDIIKPYLTYDPHFMLNSSSGRPTMSASGDKQQAVARTTRQQPPASFFFAPSTNQPPAPPSEPRKPTPTLAGQARSIRLDGRLSQAQQPQQANRAAQEGQLGAADNGGRQLDSMVTTNSITASQQQQQQSRTKVKWHQTSHNTGQSKQFVPDFSQTRPTSMSGKRQEASQIVYDTATNELPNSRISQQQPAEAANKQGWRWIESSSNAALAATAARAPTESDRPFFGQTGTDTTRQQQQPHSLAEENGQARERIRHLVSLMNQRRQLDQAASMDEAQAQRDNSSGGHFMPQLDDDRGRGRKSNEPAASGNTQEANGVTDGGSDKMPKSTVADGATATGQDDDSMKAQAAEQQDNKQLQQQAAGDDVVVELIDGGELSHETSATSAKQTAATNEAVGRAEAKQSATIDQQRQDGNTVSDANEAEQVGKQQRAYRGLVAGSIGSSNLLASS